MNIKQSISTIYTFYKAHSFSLIFQTDLDITIHRIKTLLVFLGFHGKDIKNIVKTHRRKFIEKLHKRTETLKVHIKLLTGVFRVRDVNSQKYCHSITFYVDFWVLGAVYCSDGFSVFWVMNPLGTDGG